MHLLRSAYVISCLDGQIAHSESDSNFPEEFIGRRAPGKDPDKVVGQDLQRFPHCKKDAIGSELQRDGVKDDLDFARAHALSHALRISFLDANKFASPV